jgi:hypothetical protein
MDMYRELIRLRDFRKNKFIHAFANIAKGVGLIKAAAQK